MNHLASRALRVGGMLIGYYALCPRKAWRSMRGLSTEREHGAVALPQRTGWRYAGPADG
jgi:CRISPR-associated exonuclease Cas4